MAQSKTTGAYTDSTSTGPELMQSVYPQYHILWLRFRLWSVQPDIIEVHLARTAGYRYIALGTQADCDPVNIGQDYALIRKRLQWDNPLGPGVYCCRGRIIMDHNRSHSGAVGNRHVKRLGGVAGYADILVRPLRTDCPGSRDIGEYRLASQSGVMARHRQTDLDIRTHRDVLCALHGPGRAVG